MKTLHITAQDLRLYAITDRRWLAGDSLLSAVEQALQGGITCLQLREKNLPYEEFLTTARQIKDLCRQYNVPLIIDDQIGIALACDADGLHIGQQDMPAREARKLLGPHKILGVTAKNVPQAVAAYESGADYLGSGAVFPTGTKRDAIPLPLTELRKIAAAVPIPIVAIGGIETGNISQLQGTGIAGAAVVSGIFAQKDIKKAASGLRQQCDALFN